VDDVDKMNDMEITLFLANAGISPEDTRRSLAKVLARMDEINARLDAAEEFRAEVRARVECEECHQTFPTNDDYQQHRCAAAPREPKKW
jgi:hypothetical protein